MTMNGPALIAFSLACIGAAGLLNYGNQPGGTSYEVANNTADQDCLVGGFETDVGYVGCITPVILPLAGPVEIQPLTE